MGINGAVGGLRTLFWSFLLVCVPLYAVALLLRDSVGTEAGEHGAEFFSTMPLSFFTLFRCIVSGDCTNNKGEPLFVHITSEYGFGYGILYCLVTYFMTFGLFNVIIAMYVENTVAAAKYNDIHKKQERLKDQQMLAAKVRELVLLVTQMQTEEGVGTKMSDPRTSKRQSGMHSGSRGSNVDIVKLAQDVEITHEFFERLRHERAFRNLLNDLDVADEDQADLFETLDADGGGTLDLEEMVMGIAKLRGDARRSDVVAVSLVTRSIQETLGAFMEQTTQSVEAQSNAINELARNTRLTDKAFFHPSSSTLSIGTANEVPSTIDTGR